MRQKLRLSGKNVHSVTVPAHEYISQ